MFSVFTVLDNIASFDAELILLVCSKALICHCCNRVCVFVLCPLAPVSPRSFDERLCTPASSQTYAFFFHKDWFIISWLEHRETCLLLHALPEYLCISCQVSQERSSYLAQWNTGILLMRSCRIACLIFLQYGKPLQIIWRLLSALLPNLHLRFGVLGQT